MKGLMRFLRNEEGVTAIEYGLIAALIAIAIVAGARLAGTSLNDMFNTVGNELSSASSSTP